MGLLSDDPRTEQAMRMGLLQAGLGILAHNDGRHSGMSAIGRGGLMGLQGYQGGLKAYDDAQAAEAEKAQKERQAQMIKRGREFFRTYAQTRGMDPALADSMPDSAVLDFQSKMAASVVPKEQGTPQLVEIEDPNNPGRNIKQWMIPGQQSGVRVGNAPAADWQNPAYQKFQFDKARAGASRQNVTNIIPTEGEAKAALYAQNMLYASDVIDGLEADGVDMSRLGTQAETAVASGAGNMLAGPKAQQMRQAQNQWSEQMLRMLTGAAATEDEIRRTVATYFPQPGDSREVVSQKRAMRKQAEQSVLSASGRARPRVMSPTPKGPAQPQNADSRPPIDSFFNK